MAKYISNPNPYSKTLDRKFLHIFLILSSILGGFGLAYWYSQTKNFYHAIFGYILLFAYVFVTYKLLKQIGKNDRGELAELNVKKVLFELSDSYTVFQNVQIKKDFDIDFVVVGPSGIFTVEVKSHFKAGFFARKRFINQAFAEAMLLKEYLKAAGIKMYISPVLVLTRAQTSYSAPQNGVCVTSPDFLLTFIAQARKFTFDKEKVETLIKNLYKAH